MPSLEDVRRNLQAVLGDLRAVDHAVYSAVASTPTPSLDVPLRTLSTAANYSRIWFGIAALLALVGGRTGRRAALAGAASIGATSLVNVGLKTVGRRRPDREGYGVPEERHVRMPTSTSFPSGHSAAGFAFANTVSAEIPGLAFPLRVLALSVAYSRVHTGVHYPSDALAGGIVGGVVGQTVAFVAHRGSSGSGPGRQDPQPCTGREVMRGMVTRSMLDAATADAGLYLVLLEAAAPVEVTVGKLGTFDFPAGRYVYVGSARRGLRARAGRHLRREKPLRWHIDYLTTHPGVRTIGAALVAAPPRRLTECRLGRGVRRALGARPVVPGFGASDCRGGCAAHLWWVSAPDEVVDGPLCDEAPWQR